jgi:chromosome segregation ATPase
MIQQAYIALKTVQEFLARLNSVEVNDQKQDNRIEKTENQIGAMKDKLEVMEKEITLAGKVQTYQSHEIEEMRTRIEHLEAEKAKLRSQKHGLAISAGKQKAKNKKLHVDIEALKKDDKPPPTKNKH